MASLRRWLGWSASDEAPSDPRVEPIRGALDRLKPRHAQYLSAYAAVLARVAYTDREISPEEAKVMTRIIQDVDEVPETDAELIVAIANGSARTLGDEAGREATRLLGTVATRAQRLGLLRCLFAVAGAHGGVSQDEFHKIEHIGRELGLSATDLESCRLRLGGRPPSS